MIDTFIQRLPKPKSQSGDTLIEVVISALLVGLIVVGTLTGFGNVDRATAQQRAHDEAAVLAAQSQEQLRSDPASALETIGSSGHAYTQTVAGAIYTITQKAELQPQSGSGAGCSVTETKRQSGNAFSISSTVTWLMQKATKRSAVTASSIVTPPTGSALEVDADNAPVATSGVSGVTAVVTYTPAGGGSAVTLEQTTGIEGCVVFGGIPSTEAEVEIPEIAGFVTRSGAAKYPSLGVNTQEVKLAPNYTTHHEILYNNGGAIEADFAYESKTEHEHENNEGTGKVTEKVTGDTFVAFNSNMESTPDFEVGSTNYAAQTWVYKPVPSTYKPSAESPKFLFPFPESEKKPWNVYAGDCVENNPETITSKAIVPTKAYVNPGETKTAVVPTSYVTLNLYTESEKVVNEHATEKWKYLETTGSGGKGWPVTITNHTCASAPAPPNNESAPSTKHVQATTINATSPGNGGHLADPFQPFGKEFELCVAAGGKTYTRNYEDKEAPPKGPTLPIYMGQKSSQEKKALRIREEKEEAETQIARINKEEEPKIKREEKEAEKRKEAENKEKAGTLPAAYSSTTTYVLGAEVSESGKLYESIKATNLGHTPKNSSTWWKLITRAQVESKRQSEEATTKANAEKAEEAENKTGRETAEANEKATETNRKNEEKAEATEATNSGVTVETGSSCP
jgi:Tfp pilus assembly protein PilV